MLSARTLRQRILARTLVTGFLLLFSQQGQGDGVTQPSTGSSPYVLESVELVGTERISVEQLASTFGLDPGTPLTDEFVMRTRSKLLGVGLFDSAIIRMKKGSKPGHARVIVELEDDVGILTPWALGGEVGITHSESQARSAPAPDSAPLGYRTKLVGRNLFTSLHAGSLLIDLDGNGVLREAAVNYALPPFAAESVQFEAQLQATDVSRRYLNALGFGGKGQAIWSRSNETWREIQYGIAVYANRSPLFAVPGFPTLVAGPKAGIRYETRLQSFIPQPGYLLEGAAVLSPLKMRNSVSEVGAAYTLDLFSVSALTFDIRALGVGTRGFSTRAESRLDFPIIASRRGDEQASLYARLRGGLDKFREDATDSDPEIRTNLVGSVAIFGMRYFSSGFIADLSLQITRSPLEFTTPTSEGGAMPGGRP